MSVRVKFRCLSISLPTEESPYNGAVHLLPVYSADPNSENGKFFNSTPGGKIEMNLVSEAAARQFEPGKEYYVDFTPAD
jgi:hypothetical protein